MTDKTPVFDIKPYVPVCDCHSEAKEGYTKETKAHRLTVVISDSARKKIPEEYIAGITAALEDDPRPGYRHRPEDEPRIFHLSYRDIDIPFTVKGGVVTLGEEIE